MPKHEITTTEFGQKSRPAAAYDGTLDMITDKGAAGITRKGFKTDEVNEAPTQQPPNQKMIWRASKKAAREGGLDEDGRVRPEALAAALEQLEKERRLAVDSDEE